MTNLPGGTVTFLFTDIEGSTRLWEQHPEAMRLALARHDALMREAIQAHNGHIVKGTGDGLHAVFARASDGLAACLAAQLAFQADEPKEPASIRIRMALHTGSAQERDGDYFGSCVNRAARLMSIGHGGQVLLSEATCALVRETLPAPAGLRDMGRHRLRDLNTPEQVAQLLHPALPAAFPPLQSLDAFATNLPVQLTSFIGREKELSEVQDLLARTRLLTLTGSGGCGKTRLALQAAAEMLEAFPDGVWLAELAALSDPALVAQTVAQALGAREEPGREITQTLAERLKSQRALLILDNCEHVLTPCARLADALLRACPQVKILATSREGLGIAGEQQFRVPSLSLPELERPPAPASLYQFEAVRLFIERALLCRSDFALTEANAPVLASVCWRLDGIPLAIELAAARVRSMAVEEIHARLDNRFRLLTSGSRTALPRQQTLKALIDWSYELLTPAERTLLARLSVFAGGWTLEAAEQVIGNREQGRGNREQSRKGLYSSLFPVPSDEVLDVLTSLVEKSLVIYEEGDGGARYRLLETVRQYARERLMESGEMEAVRGQHGAYFLALAREARPQLLGPEQKAWFDRLEREHDNLRAGLAWFREEADGAQAGLQMAESLWQFWHIRGYLREGREWLQGALARPEAQAPTAERAKALNGAGNLASTQGDYAAARTLYEESLAIHQQLEDRLGIATAIGNLARVAYLRHDFPGARQRFEESLAIRQEMGDRRGIALSLNNLANVYHAEGDNAMAHRLYEEALATWRALGDTTNIAYALRNLGMLTLERGDTAAARRLLEESLAMRREIGDRRGIAYALAGLGEAALGQGELATARAYFEECLTHMQEMGERLGTGEAHRHLAKVDLQAGDPSAARAHYRAAIALYQEMDDPAALLSIIEDFAAYAGAQGEALRTARFWARSPPCAKPPARPGLRTGARRWSAIGPPRGRRWKRLPLKPPGTREAP